MTLIECVDRAMGQLFFMGAYGYLILLLAAKLHS